MYLRRHDSSIGFGAPVRANMRTGSVTSASVTSSLLETVSLVVAYLFFIVIVCMSMLACKSIK